MGRLRTHREVDAFLVLLRSGLWEIPPKGFDPLSPEEWRSVRRLSEEQTISAIVFSGLSRLPEHLLPPEEILLEWLARTEAVRKRSDRTAQAQEDLLEFFARKGLRPIVQKGLSLAPLYPDPQLRQSGDIDLYFPGDFDKAEEALRRNRTSFTKEADGSLSYRWQGIPVEHHPHCLDIANPLKIRKAATLEKLHGAESQEVTLLLLSTHILKHCLGRGVGLRQFCDFALLLRKASTESSPEAAASLGLGKWDRLLRSFVLRYLTPEPVLPSSPRLLRETEKLLALVLSGGNFGQYRNISGAAAKALPKEGTARSGKPDSGICRKTATFASFCRNFSFGMRTAPAEYIFTILALTAGQLRSIGKRKIKA